MTRPLPRFADLRNGGNLPRKPINRHVLSWAALVAFFALTGFAIIHTLTKFAQSWVILTCGAC